MAGHTNKQSLKQQAIQALTNSRANLRHGLTHAREQLNPKHIAKTTVRNHGLLTLSIAAISGFIIARKIFSSPPQNSSDTSAKSARKKRSITAIILASVWGLAREPLLTLASQHAMPLAMNYFEKWQQSKNHLSHITKKTPPTPHSHS